MLFTHCLRSTAICPVSPPMPNLYTTNGPIPHTPPVLWQFITYICDTRYISARFLYIVCCPLVIACYLFFWALL
ncbi:hypothetical protein PAXRUDRAFT_407475 [Paxillus rubicundulus Ve08.2h10]|uniref:Uncharacterized protein n=1 Tax=Paxillus rubicundulus Ve08.2h10 TaxID=930991 RepID=A0A0D0E2X7_9AGAM|nr:hypothetical protein PAXRUDRAFT_407475 [Paxillus rubicundulus Ve08.2h10]